MPSRALRILTAVAAYDGHDASVLTLNRALLAGPEQVEVICLGYNKTGEQIASAALAEGADAVAVSSCGGGGTILPEDARSLESAGCPGSKVRESTSTPSPATWSDD